MEGQDVNAVAKNDAVEGLALILKVRDSFYTPTVLLYKLCRIHFLIVNTFFIKVIKHCMRRQT